MTCRYSVQATVIGTGFGGSVAACRLSQAGFAPLVLERGRRYEEADFPVLPPRDGFLPDTRRLAWGPNQGLVDVQDLDEIMSVQVAGYGGGSLLYANVHLRPRREIFDQVVKRGKGRCRLWPEQYSRATLDEFYDLVASMLDVAPITEHAEGPRLVKADQLKRAATALHRDAGFFYPPLAISRRNGNNAHQKEQGACVHCGACCMGCPHRAKNSLDFNYLAIAEEHGATVRTQCEVLEIERTAEGYQVHYIDHLTARRECAETKFLFLCAGSVHTTRLLAAAKLNRGDKLERKLKARVGLGYWPNADALGVVFDTKNPQHPSWGPAITGAMVFQDRQAGDPARGWFMIQDASYARELERAIGLFRSPAWAGRNRFPKPADAAVVDASEPGPRAEEPRTGAPPLPSVLDAILGARASGALDLAVPKQLADALHAIRDDVAGLFLPVIVADTIERALRDRFRRILRWLGGSESCLSRAFLSSFRWLARRLGTPNELARNAQDSLQRLGGLPDTEIAKRLLGYSNERPEHRTMLLAMGPDSTPGVLHYEDGRLIADLDLYHLAPRYLDEELAMRDIAAVLGGELRVNPAWAFLGKPITVHSQGGCRLSEMPERGVLNPDGQVWGCPGLYVLDGASLCSSVGANPSATIAAIAERNILRFIRSQGTNTHWPEDDVSRGATEYRKQRVEARRWIARAREQRWTLEPPSAEPVDYRSRPIGLAFDERMQGFHADPAAGGERERQFRKDVRWKVDETYRLLESLGRPAYPLEVHLTPHIEDLARFFEDKLHCMNVTGTVRARLTGDEAVGEFAVRKGSLSLFRARHKKHALVDDETIAAQKSIAGSYTSQAPRCGRVAEGGQRRQAAQEKDERDERLMWYQLQFTDRRGTEWCLKGYKRIKDDPGLDAWRDTTTLFVRLFSDGKLRSAGAIHVDLPGFLVQLQSMRIVSGGTDAMPDPDPARVAWTLMSFAQFFFGNLQRIYPGTLGTALDSLLRAPGTSSRS